MEGKGTCNAECTPLDPSENNCFFHKIQLATKIDLNTTTSARNFGAFQRPDVSEPRFQRPFTPHPRRKNANIGQPKTTCLL